jgi:plasmid stabilization system protein ParE
MKVTWTARARTRLSELHDYIAQDSKPRALAMVERLLDRSESLEVAPRSGARLPAFVDDEVRELVERRSPLNADESGAVRMMQAVTPRKTVKPEIVRPLR